VKSYKGENRPIVPEQERLRTIAALGCVDYVFLFDERRNRTNLEILKPDLYIKSGDYKKEELTSRDALQGWGGEAVVLPLVEGLSTSNLIEKIKAAPVERVAKRGPAIFLDRDGTINKHVQYLHEPKKFEFLPGVLEAVKELYDMQYKIVIVTNQPGISLGYFQKEDLFDVNSKMLKGFSEAGILIQKIYFCPHSDAEKCDCRKPKPGMLKRAETELGVDMEHSFMIGDSVADILAGAQAGVKTILLTELDNFPTMADHAAKNLLSAVDWIKRQEDQRCTRPPEDL
jgi:histidinol-phosphate phosphatase family protein